MAGVIGESDFFLQVYEKLLKRTEAKTLVICASTEQAMFLKDFLEKNLSLSVDVFPDWELMPYDLHFVDSSLIQQRYRVLQKMDQADSYCILTSPCALAPRVPSPAFLKKHHLSWNVGQRLDRKDLLEQWELLGYQQVPQVSEPEEFAVRGEIIDVFLPNHIDPLRLTIIDNILESIRTFNPQNQRSLESKNVFHLSLSKHWPIQKDIYDQAIKAFREDFSNRDSVFYRTLQSKQWPQGIDFFCPLFFKAEPLYSVQNYLHEEVQILAHSQSSFLYEQFLEKARQNFASFSISMGFSPYAVETIFSTAQELSACWAGKAILCAQRDLFSLSDAIEAISSTNPSPIFTISSRAQLPLLESRLKDFGLKYHDVVETMSELSNLPCVLVAPLEAITFYRSRPIIPFYALVHRPMPSRVDRSEHKKSFSKDSMLQDLWADVNYVIYEKHGLARYHGLKTLNFDNEIQEFIELEYHSGAKLFLPLSEIDQLTPYRTEQDDVVLHQMGQSAWSREREKALKSVEDHAAQLLALYAKRSYSIAFQHHIPQEYAIFSQEFPFVPTHSQEEAFEAVLFDLAQSKPMDRLLCGDVGFGKTEVALRAAFVSVMNKKQVLVLAPTTILAHQHYETFLQRMHHWGISLALLTRNTKKEKEVLEKIASGQYDIIIGTHKILEKTVVYKDLGLLIIDEEHRFGVRDKERIQEVRGHIHLLSMTATPIPRTLSLALDGLRDLSLMLTPPAARRKILTSVHVYHTGIIQQAIERELFRSGQVYYLCNDIDQIARKVQSLSALCPKARISFVHGQMSHQDIEYQMMLFYQHEIDVLVSTTIIETGIDVPRAHAIIIENAQNFGLAQLHQLRGRVGRSAHQSYAYCLIPVPKEHLSVKAVARLEALCRYQDLGSGYHIATEDMELRGSGEILGAKQSGHIQSLGLEYYQKALKNAHHHLKDPQEAQKEYQIKVDLGSSVPLSHIQIPDPLIRLMLYRSWSDFKTWKDFFSAQDEFKDRFGTPDALSSRWIAVHRCRIFALEMGIQEISFYPKGPLMLRFILDSPALTACIQCIQNAIFRAKPAGPYGVSLLYTDEGIDKRIEKIEFVLEQLSTTIQKLQ